MAGERIDVEYIDLPAGVEGWSRGGRIAIRRGLLPAEEFSVMVHEVAHELLHSNDTDRRDRKTRETEAEAVAFVVCEAKHRPASNDAGLARQTRRHS